MIIEILERWPSRRALLEDARVLRPDIELVAVHRWFQRGVIPGAYDIALLHGAGRRGIELTPQELLSARRAYDAANQRQEF
ncbi:hypothetical protein [Thioclava kandeliae]|uniref:Uncharacterized protein n=1 Tax=Thioclava kandeliae TaxID=3070818 RepID=A0ABV1SKF6_9RHOB